MTENGDICKAHSGFKAEILDLKGNVSRLWEKWDAMQKMIIGIFVALVFNLLGVMVILVKIGK